MRHIVASRSCCLSPRRSASCEPGGPQGIGAAFLGASGALLAGVGDMDRSERGRLVVNAGLLGGVNLSGGLVTLLIESDLERAFERAYGTGDVSSVGIHVGVTPVRGGGALQMGGTF